MKRIRDSARDAPRPRGGPERPLLIDGAVGTELRRRGVRLDPVAWSGPAALTHPEVLTAIHADYLEAGADVITTNTFGATRFVLDAAGFGADVARIVRASIAAAAAARARVGREALIAGSISCLPPGFDVQRYPRPAAERAAYEELATLLADGGVNLIALEMMEDTVHARLAIDAVRAVGLPVWLGLSARRLPDGRLVAYDFPETRLESLLDALLDAARPAVVNLMHTPAEDVLPALNALERRWKGRTGAYPEVPESRTAGKAVTPKRLAALAVDWLNQGVSVIGGCCGTTPAHVRALRSMLERADAGDGAWGEGRKEDTAQTDGPEADGQAVDDR